MPYPHSGAARPSNGARPWILAGAMVLAAVAGFVNVVVLGVFHVPVSHMSGAASRISMDLAARNYADLQGVVSILGGFLLGAMLSGLVIGGRTVVPGRRYGIAMLFEAIVLAMAAILLAGHHFLGVALAGMACGIQNGMASSYYGLVIRTTHVTGIVTDIGVMLGQAVRHGRFQIWKLCFLSGILAGFVAGGICGALAYLWIDVAALMLPAATCFLGGAAYLVWRSLHLRIA